MAIDLLTIGDTQIDLFFNIDAKGVTKLGSIDDPKVCFTHGSKINVEEIQAHVGGNAYNVASGVQKLGLSTTIYTEVGDDDFASKITATISKNGIDSSIVAIKPNTMSNLTVVLALDGERTIFSYHHPRKYSLPDISKINPKVIYYTSLGKGFMEFQLTLTDYLDKHKDIILAFSPGSLQLKNGLNDIKEVLHRCSILLLNKEEAQVLVGQHELLDLHKKLHELGPKLTLITDNVNGSSAYDGKEYLEMNIFNSGKPILDKTGAGDAYASGFIAALIYKKPLKEAMTWGKINSGSEITQVGSTVGLLNLEEMEKLVS